MKWLDKKIKKFVTWDIVLIIIATMFLTLLISMLRPELINGKYSGMWIALFIIALVKPLYVLFFKK